jgi:predicted kinase
MSDFIRWMKNRDVKLYYEFISQDEFGNENKENKKELVVLVGPPAVGKSTYIANKFDSKDVFVVSRDDIVDEVAKSMGLTYDDMFALPPKDSIPNTSVEGMEKYGLVEKAPLWMTWTKVVYKKIVDANEIINSQLKQKFKEAVDSGKNVVVDMTNMTAKIRQSALNYAKDKDFFRRAVVFTFAESDLPEIFNRMRKRSAEIASKGGSKTIGEDVVHRMIKSFEKVSPEEGFDKVETVGFAS